MPAVSVMINSLLKRLYLVSIESLVVPDILVTIFLSSPSRTLMNDDLPTFGLPRIDILGNFSLLFIDSFSNLLTTKSSKSPVPDPL